MQEGPHANRTSPLKENGLFVSYAIGKSDFLSRQYSSVFTQKYVSDIQKLTNLVVQASRYHHQKFGNMKALIRAESQQGVWLRPTISDILKELATQF